MNFKKFEVYGNPTLQQGGWVRTGEGDNYVDYMPDYASTYYYRICTLEYIPQYHPTQITITGIASKELELSVLVLRSDNYIIASLGWQDNGYTFNLGSTYDKLGVMFRFKNGDVISPDQVSFDIVGDWHDIPHYIMKTSTDTLTTLPADLYADGNNATVGISGNTVQNGTPTPENPIMPQGCGDLETVGAKAGQYKIPISSANTTTSVYLGEVQTTRKIKKLVLTGEENIQYNVQNKLFYFMLTDVGINSLYALYCSHFQKLSDNPELGVIMTNSGAQIRIYDTNLIWQSASDFKQFIRDEYAAGTPVTVWYVLAAPETGIVNEPLMKIGDDADTVSGISIPTITSKDTFDVDTTLKPSEVSLSYTGWHDATVEEWDGSQWNE